MLINVVDVVNIVFVDLVDCNVMAHSSPPHVTFVVTLVVTFDGTFVVTFVVTLLLLWGWVVFVV